MSAASRPSAGAARVGAATFLALAVLGVAGFSGLAAQPSLDQYDYENLRLRGGGVEVFVVAPKDLDTTIGFGGRLDLGFLGPNIRVLPRGAYWSTELSDEEIGSLETRIEDLVVEQGGPRPTIDLGTVDRSALVLGSDLHWLPLVTEMVRPYVGLGAELYILSGSGTAIEGTFVEDALDLMTAGVSGVGGVEVDVGSGLTVYGDVRGTLVADVGGFSLTAGVGYLVP